MTSLLKETWGIVGVLWLMLWPFLIVGGFTFIMRNNLKRKLVFYFIGVAFSYLVFYATMQLGNSYVAPAAKTFQIAQTREAYDALGQRLHIMELAKLIISIVGLAVLLRFFRKSEPRNLKTVA